MCLQHTLPAISALLAEDLKRYECCMDEAIAAQEGYLTALEKGLYKSGKKLRPIILLLSARICLSTGSNLPDKVIRAAVSLEMLHVATLIHDDIIDQAPLRRGYPSIKAARGTEMAILIGDLQFLQSIRGLLDSVVVQEDIAIIDNVLKAGYEICLGEIDELHMDPATAYDDLLELECRYLNIIDRKTAMLFGISCESGAALVGARKKDLLVLSQFGRALGKAFQIMDDIHDFLEAAGSSGKEPNTDLMQKKLSLPIINTLRELPAHNPLHRFLTSSRHDDTLFQEALATVLSSGGLETSYATARELMTGAIRQLDHFPDSTYKKGLETMAYSIINNQD